MSRFRRRIGFAVFAALIGAGLPSFAQTLAPADAVAEFNRLLAVLPSTPADRIPAVTATIPRALQIEHDGQSFDYSTRWISDALERGRKDPESWPKYRHALVSRIVAARREVGSLVQTGETVDMERPRAVVADVLAQKEFGRQASKNLFMELIRWISEWIASMWERFGGNRIMSGNAPTVIAWVLAAAALVGLSWWLIVSLMRVTDRGSLSLTPPASRRRSARAWAQQAASAGEPREVIRCGYRAAVAGLEEEGAWRADDARTPREHLRLLSSEHRRRGLFADVARRFEEVWFGARTPTPDDSREILARLKELGCLSAD